MRFTGYLAVIGTFIGVALITYGVIRMVGWDATDFALLAGAIIATQVGTWLWHREAPHAPERSVKMALGMLLSVTAVVFAVVFQAISGWLEYPEIVIPIAAIGCFAFPFLAVGSLWKAFSAGKASEQNHA